MSVSSRDLVDLVLLGPSVDRRQLQDSPVLGDVWAAFAMNPAQPKDLLITPAREMAAGPVAVIIAKRLGEVKSAGEDAADARVAYLQGLVAAHLSFRQLLRVIVPMTRWWKDRRVQNRIATYTDTPVLDPVVQAMIAWAQATSQDARARAGEAFAQYSALDRYVALAGIILWAGYRSSDASASYQGIGDAMADLTEPEPVVAALRDMFTQIRQDLKQDESGTWTEPQIWMVNLNRRAMPALSKSVPAVKGDAARTLFRVHCNDIHWAILDSGIDDSHPAFTDKTSKRSRIVKAYDFSNVRNIVSLHNSNIATVDTENRLKKLLQGRECARCRQETRNPRRRCRKRPPHSLGTGRGVHRDSSEGPSPRCPTTRDTRRRHPRCQAGGKDQRARRRRGTRRRRIPLRLRRRHVPGHQALRLPRAVQELENTEFAIIAALQFIRYLNERHTYISVHGANLSLSIPHDVRNFACGRTPICNECERLVESGVVVVAAAGNLGYQRFETAEGPYRGVYRVQHQRSRQRRRRDHRRLNPPLPGPHVWGQLLLQPRSHRRRQDEARCRGPGERIASCLPGGEWGELDGTSMAAPHVSGAAAMLMARYAEMIGEPRRVKRVLCESATDLGRERSFQGNGMLDVLRAFQRLKG